MTLYDPSTIHADVLLNERERQLAWEVANDLESGAIGDEQQTQLRFWMSDVADHCGSPLCMAGHIAFRLLFSQVHTPTTTELWQWYTSKVEDDRELEKLFASTNPSDPKLAAEGLRHYLATGIGQWPHWKRKMAEWDKDDEAEANDANNE